jgi:hypothetical protein
VGWGSGSSLLSQIADLLEECVPGDLEWKHEFYDKLISLFEDYDCDTIDEAYGGWITLNAAIDRWRLQFED